MQQTTRRWLLTALIAVAVLGLGAVLGVGFARDPSVVGSPLIDEPAPRLAGPTLDGDHFTLADHAGEVVLVNVWASWCGPCEKEFPVLVDAARELGPHGLQVVGVNSGDNRDDARAFVAEHGADGLFPHVEDPSRELAVEWGVFGLPESYVVDRDGVVRAKVVGLLTHQWVAEEVVPLLEES